jgi:hypothetical protein
LILKNKYLGKTALILGNGPSLNKHDFEQLSGQFIFGQNKIYLKKEVKPSIIVAVNDKVIEQSEKEFANFDGLLILPFSRSRSLKNKCLNIRTHPDNKFSFFPWYRVYEGATVTFVSMQLAFYLGFKKVILIGVDHNFVQIGKPNTEQFLSGNDVNHFHPGYFANMKWDLADIETSEASYFNAKIAYENAGREIVDCTIGGKLQVFRKSQIEKEVVI